MPLNEVVPMFGKPDISNEYLLFLCKEAQISAPILQDTIYFNQTSIIGLITRR